MEKNSGFYVVWNPARGGPTVRHPTRRSAAAEAERLARANPGQSFFVLGTVAVAEVPVPSVLRDLAPVDSDAGIPF